VRLSARWMHAHANLDGKEEFEIYESFEANKDGCRANFRPVRIDRRHLWIVDRTTSARGQSSYVLGQSVRDYNCI
jgi:hypothetical protein